MSTVFVGIFTVVLATLVRSFFLFRRSQAFVVVREGSGSFPVSYSLAVRSSVLSLIVASLVFALLVLIVFLSSIGVMVDPYFTVPLLVSVPISLALYVVSEGVCKRASEWTDGNRNGNAHANAT